MGSAQAATSAVLAPRGSPGDSARYGFRLAWADGVEDVRRRIVEEGLMAGHGKVAAAGADVASMTLVHRAQLFSLAHDMTKLKKSDYEFLRRFIDATKANLFFARGIAIVEGPANPRSYSISGISAATRNTSSGGSFRQIMATHGSCGEAPSSRIANRSRTSRLADSWMNCTEPSAIRT